MDNTSNIFLESDIKQPVGSWDNLRIVSQSYVNKILNYHLTAWIRVVRKCSVDNIKQSVGSWDNLRIVSQSYVNKILNYHLTAWIRIVRECSNDTISKQADKDQESIQSSESPYWKVTKTQGNITFKRAIPAGDHKAARNI